MSRSTTHRASPFHCPYCGDVDLYPREEGGARDWECRACLRAFAVTYLGQVARPPRTGQSADQSADQSAGPGVTEAVSGGTS